jgi:hypothetical protein
MLKLEQLYTMGSALLKEQVRCLFPSLNCHQPRNLHIILPLCTRFMFRRLNLNGLQLGCSVEKRSVLARTHTHTLCIKGGVCS